MNIKMDWEGKVSSLLRETQSNLTRMKRKVGEGSGGFRGYTDWKSRRSYCHTSPTMRKFSSMSDISPRTVQFANNLMTSPPRQGTQPSTMSDVYSPVNRTSYMSGNASTYTASAANSAPVFTQSLQEKLDQQNKLIDQLMQMVHKLESERNNYGEQIRDMRGEIKSLGMKMYDKNCDNVMERRVEQVKRELMSDIHVLQNQVQLYQNRGDNHVPDVQVSSLTRDLHDMKHTLREEMETVRRDVEVLKSRLMKLEIDMSEVCSNRKDLERRQDRIDRTVQDMSSSSSSPLKTAPNPYWSPGQASNTSDKLHMSELRSTISTLKHKVDNMEASIHSRDVGQLPPTAGNRTYTHTNGYHSESTSVMDLEELDLSDDDTSLDTFAGAPAKRKVTTKDPDNLNLDSDEDLDLDDLDLSDEDTPSLDSEHF